VNPYLTAISMLSVFIPIAVGMYKLRALSIPMRVLLILVITSLAFDSFSEIVAHANQGGNSNLWVLNLYTPIETIIYCVFFILVLKDLIHQKILIVIYLVPLAFILHFTYKHGNRLSDVSLAIESITVIASAMIFFYVMLKRLEHDTPLSNPYFWFNSAILIYFSSAFFVFIFSDYRRLSSDWNLWNIHSIVRIIFNLLISIGFWKAQKTTT
jgi:hypothetical protein